MKHSVNSDEWLFNKPTYPDIPGTKSNDDTSQGAAKNAASLNSVRKQMCLESIIAKPGASREIAQRLGWDNYTVAPVLSQLRALGLIKDSGKRFTTPMKRPAIVWMATKL